MKKSIKFLAIALGLAAVACSSPEKMAEQAENVIVKCDPAVLEVVAEGLHEAVPVAAATGGTLMLGVAAG